MTEMSNGAVQAHEATNESGVSIATDHAHRIQEFIDHVSDTLLDNSLVLDEHSLAIEAAQQAVRQTA